LRFYGTATAGAISKAFNGENILHKNFRTKAQKQSSQANDVHTNVYSFPASCCGDVINLLKIAFTVHSKCRRH